MWVGFPLVARFLPAWKVWGATRAFDAPAKRGQRARKALSAQVHALIGVLGLMGTPGRPKREATDTRTADKSSCVSVAAEARKEFRVSSQALLLTYQGFPADLATFLNVWARFLVFARTLVGQLKVEQWTATAETNEDGKHHLHLMLKFRSKLDRCVSTFVC